MITCPPSATAPVAPALVATVLDGLAVFPLDAPLDPQRMWRLVCAVGGSERIAAALLVRIRATAIVLADPRWPHWAAYVHGCDADAHRAFDVVLVRVIATLPLDNRLHFTPDNFYDALLAGVARAERG